MRQFLIFLVVLVCTLNQAHGLDCYVCESVNTVCSSGKTCGSGYDACYVAEAIMSGLRVEKRNCGYKDMCTSSPSGDADIDALLDELAKRNFVVKAVTTGDLSNGAVSSNCNAAPSGGGGDDGDDDEDNGGGNGSGSNIASVFTMIAVYTVNLIFNYIL